MQTTVTQQQALHFCAQQLDYVTQQHILCLDTAQEILEVMQVLLDSTTDFAATVASTRYSNDEVNESKYLEEIC